MDSQLSLSPLPVLAEATQPTSMPLPPEAIYNSKEELYIAIQAFAARYNYAFCISRSTKAHGSRTRIVYSCDRYGLLPPKNHP
jgi:hypothetical protein